MAMNIDDSTLRDAALTYAQWNQTISERGNEKIVHVKSGEEDVSKVGQMKTVLKSEVEYFNELEKPKQQQLVKSIETLMAFFKQNTEDAALEKLKSLGLGDEKMIMGHTRVKTVGKQGIEVNEKIEETNKVGVSLASRVSQGRVERSADSLRSIYYKSIDQQVPPTESEPAKTTTFFEGLKGRFGLFGGSGDNKTK
jgi:hypothetical protein